MAEKKKQTATAVHNLDKECQCLFCGGRFAAREIEFCVDVPASDNRYDQTFEDHIRQYKGCEGEDAPYRIWIDWADDVNNVQNWETEDIPFSVRGTLRGVDGSSKSDNYFSQFSQYGWDDETQEEDEEQSDDKLIWRKSSIRVCPHCHMTLPNGFMTDKKIRVGLMGGRRSGKTTYMVVAAKYLQQRLHGMGNGIGLGTITLVPECEKCIDRIYNEGVAPTELKDDDQEREDPPVLPIIMRITPSNTSYPPFCMILQDIPGEYMSPEPRYREMLASSNIKDSTDLIMLIDINHFIETRQSRDNHRESERYGEYCTLDINRIFENLENLGMCLNAETLKSLQIALTKLDFWKEEDERIGMTAFGVSGDLRHKGAISEGRLKLVDAQMRAVLSQMYGADYNGLINVFKERLNVKGADIVSAYTAVASKTVPEHESAFTNGTEVNFSYSLNVLEPLLNICAAHGVLPVKCELFDVVPNRAAK